MARVRFLALLAPLLLPCAVRPTQEPGRVSVEAAVYLAEGLARMREVSFHRERLDWRRIRREAFEAAAGAEEPADTYEALRGALNALGDHHSFLQLTEELAAHEEERRRARGLSAPVASGASGPAVSPFAGRVQPEGVLHETPAGPVGRIVVPFFMGADATGFARRLQELVAELDAHGPRGWIIDLRGNGGGNMWPMLAGVGPILGEGRCGAFLELAGPAGHWFYRDGKSGTETDALPGGVVIVKVEPPYRLRDPEPAPVAVLIDEGTASSGEALAIAFVGRPRTRLFGAPSYGLSSSNNGFRLADGANLVITVGLDMDRTGKSYADRVLPDEALEGPRTPDDEDLPLARALDWLIEAAG